MEVIIDENAGFCFGVTNAISKVEKHLNQNSNLYCLGELVHNEEETIRLQNLGLKTITYNDFSKLYGQIVLFRAHGEPPSIYNLAKQNNITIIDATCPIVLKLQQKILENYKKNPQSLTVIFGKKDHPEVLGLNGQVDNNAIIIQQKEDLQLIDYKKDIFLYSQTTMSSCDYDAIAEEIDKRYKKENPNGKFVKIASACRSVGQRAENLNNFCKNFDVILFVGGKKSSNAKYLFESCKKINNNTFFVSSAKDLTKEMFKSSQKVGITGATSTPKWLLNQIKIKTEEF